ncbi:hypothetical protein DITRI_Ditri13aG0062100 [Diplodiscus trichospermus]
MCFDHGVLGQSLVEERWRCLYLWFPVNFLITSICYTKPAESDSTMADAPTKAEKFAQKGFAEILDDIKKDPESHGGPTDCIVLVLSWNNSQVSIITGNVWIEFSHLINISGSGQRVEDNGTLTFHDVKRLIQAPARWLEMISTLSETLSSKETMQLYQFVMIYGVLILVLVQVSSFHSLRCHVTGSSNNAPPKDYSVKGSKQNRSLEPSMQFQSLQQHMAILPEIQATAGGWQTNIVLKILSLNVLLLDLLRQQLEDGRQILF